MKVLHLSEEEATDLVLAFSRQLDQTKPLEIQLQEVQDFNKFFRQVKSTFGLIWRDDHKKFVRSM